MKVPLPNLDDRRWADLVEEGRSLIPLYAPDWTDHNVHDPGITLMELFAWVAEMDIYQLNRISDEHKRKFLALVGIALDPPRPARTVLGFTFKNGPQPPRLRAGTEFSGRDSFGRETRFRTLEALDLTRGELRAVQISGATGFQDVTELWRRGEPFGAFGAIPEAGAELYLGFTEAFRVNERTSLYFKFAGAHSDDEARRRLIEEEAARKQACRPPASDVTCKSASGAQSSRPPDNPKNEHPPHHGVRLAWDFSAQPGWLPLTPGTPQLSDDTRALTLDGRIVVSVQAQMGKRSVGRVAEALYYLRCRFDAGSYDAPPFIEAVVLNGVRAEQATPVSVSWAIRAGVVATGPPPQPGKKTPLRLRLDAERQVTQIDFDRHADDAPLFKVLAYQPATAVAAGLLAIEARVIGRGKGLPHQRVTLPEAPVQKSSLDLFTLEGDDWHVWRLRDDFDASTREGADYLLEPSAGEVTFGDGERGRVPPRGALIFAAYRSTRAEGGVLEARAIYQLVDSPHNRAVVTDFDGLKDRFRTSFKITESALANLRTEGVPDPILDRLEDIKDQEVKEEQEFARALEVMIGDDQADRYGQSILRHSRTVCDVDATDCIAVSNPVPTAGGARAETLGEAAGRAVRLMGEAHRAVTLKDYEELAVKTPGTRIARVAALSNLHPSFPCLKAPGVITLIVLPQMPLARPTPSPGLRRAVTRYINRRRVIGTRVEVVGPTYLEVAVLAKVKAQQGISREGVQRKISDALDSFLDPFRGGPDGTGWPFGRDVYRSEILHVIGSVEGVEHIFSLSLMAEGGDAQCGNVCLGPTWLVAAGRHEIEVI